MEDSDGRQSGVHAIEPRQAPNDQGGVAELLARVEAATGPDWEIDAALALHFGWTIYDDGMGRMDLWRDPDGKIGGGLAPSFSASLDAALALVERVLPGWMPTIRRRGIGALHEWWVELQWWRDTHSAWGVTAPLALLAALLRALSIHPDAKSAPVVGEGDMASVAQSASEGLRPFASDGACQSEKGS